MFNLKSNVDENQLKVINAEKTRLLYSSLAVSLYATITASVCFSAVQWDVVPHSRIIIWQTLILLVVLIRATTLLAYQRARPDDDQIERWKKFFVTGTAAAGIAWGLGGILLFPAHNPEHQVLVILVMLAMAAGAMTSLGIIPFIFLLFVTPTMLPVLPVYILADGPQPLMVIIMMLLSFGFFLRASLNISRITEQNIQARLFSHSREMEKGLEVERQRQELLEMESIYQNILDNNPDGVAIISDKGKIQLVNNRLANLTGYTTQALIGSSADDIIPMKQASHISTGNILGEQLRQNPGPVDSTLYLIRRDGGSVPVDITLSPLQLDGRTYTVAYVHDITFRIENERRLSQYKHIADNSPDLMLLVGADMTYKAVNSSFLKALGLKEENVLEHHTWDVIPDPTRVELVR